MSKPPKIDITKSVMSQIDSGEVRMKPRAYFTALKALKVGGLLLVGLLLIMTIFYAVVIVQNGVFKEYLEFGKRGASIFWSSLPWGAIVISALLAIAMGLGVYLVQQKKRLVPSLIGVVVAVALVTALLFKLSPDPTTNALARAVVGIDGNPTKIAGTVEEKQGDKLKIKTSTGEVVIVEIDENTLGDKSFEVGDELLVLGNKQKGTIEADAIKATKRAERSALEIKQQEPIKTEPEAKPTEEPKPEQKPTATAPVVTQPTVPSEPTVPLVFDGGISIYRESGYVRVKFSLNKAETGKCRAYFKQGSVLKDTGYIVVSSPTTSCTVSILETDLGSGAWQVDAYFKYPYNVWSEYLNKQGTITLP